MKLQVLPALKYIFVEYRDAYSNLSKVNLSQQSQIFNEKKLKDSECQDLLNKVIYLLNQVRVNQFDKHFIRVKTSQISKNHQCSLM